MGSMRWSNAGVLGLCWAVLCIVCLVVVRSLSWSADDSSATSASASGRRPLATPFAFCPSIFIARRDHPATGTGTSDSAGEVTPSTTDDNTA
jgi:hypothetical protein